MFEIKVKILIFFNVLIVETNQQSLLDGFVKLMEENEDQYLKEPPDVPSPLPEYDFVVVGAGAAGCVLANRLSENPTWKILLVEAGDRESYIMDFPAMANYFQFTPTNWKFVTEPSDKFCLGMENQQCHFPRGKVVGGSTSINYMVYNRGNRRDYDNWAKLGNEGWAFEDVLPYFEKLEDFEHNNRSGPLRISYPPFASKISGFVKEASMQFGLAEVDSNGTTQVGVSRIQATMRDGMRESANHAYLHPIRNRRNFHLVKNAMVTKILIDPDTKKAEGVEYVKNGLKHIVKTSKEVLVSAGSINTPQILMLSGVGPKKHLERLGVSVVSNLKVGYNLMDHFGLVGLTFFIDHPYDVRMENLVSMESIRQFWNYHKGPFTIPGGLELLIFYDSKNPSNLDGYPDVELMVFGGTLSADPLLKNNFGFSEALFDSYFESIKDHRGFMAIPLVLRPKSRGRIFLKNGDYRSKPLIYPNYFAHSEELDTIVKGIRLFLNITKQEALQRIGTKLHNIPFPLCKHLDFGTDEYFKCAARVFTFTVYHYSGTCKMGPRNDKSAVVDSRLRVYGVDGLRVVGEAIFPEIPAAHICASVYMVAEKGADMIKEDWK